MNRRKNKSSYRHYNSSIGNRKVVVQGYEPQAIDYLIREMRIDPSDLLCEKEFNDSLHIRYKYRKKMRTYYPDLYIISKRIIVEVKSTHTLGVLGNIHRGWSMTCAKAIACHEMGFGFMLLLLDKHGNRLLLPKNWPKMRKKDFIRELEHLNPVEKRVGLFQL